ncbi:MAG TPA: hypothetical protein VM222_06245 [Planctomycetota bacterium]|nr:hypothetical protein [Planctomycetota bacterium]
MKLRGLRAGVVLAFLAIASCAQTESAPASPGWKTLTPISAFRVTVPSDLIEIPVKAIDSFVNHYKSSTLELDFDFGWYSSTLSEWKDPKVGEYSEELTVISGRQAKLVFSRVEQDNVWIYVAGVHFPEVARDEGQVTGLTVTLESVQPIDPFLARRIFTSIRFPVK